jgi:CBS domain-containing protein
VAALDPVAYVRGVAPFHLLPEGLWLEAASALEIALFENGARLVVAGGEPLRHLHVIRRGAVRLERDGEVFQVLEEGEVFGYTSLISGQASIDVVVEDPLLAYLLPAAAFQGLLAGDARFAAHFAVGLTERLKASLAHARVARFEPDVGVEVAQLVRRPAVWVPADASVRETARVMRDEHVSSVLVRGDPPAIVTDRDLRNRVLGQDLGPEIPAAQVSSRPLRTVDAATPLYEAWRTLLDAGVNHLPVVRDGEILGVLTSTDLLRHSAQGPVSVLRRFERLASRDALPTYAPRVVEMASALSAAGLDATIVAGLVAQLDGTLLRRLLHLAEAELGPPPAPYAWLLFGSEARRERIVPTDQDNGLAYADGAPRDWYRRLAERVTADLAAAGFPPCPAGRMASRWFGSVTDWTREIETTLEARPWEASLYLDLRRGAGTLDVAPLEAVLARAPRHRHLVRVLAKQALAFAPPASLLLRLRGGGSRVDVKRHGLSPIVFLARPFALEAESRSVNTLDRLDDALAAGTLSEATHAAVSEAFRFLLGLRLAVQLRAAAAGRPPSQEVALAELTAIERTRLKDAFRAIARWQESAAYRWEPDLVMSGPPGS